MQLLALQRRVIITIGGRFSPVQGWHRGVTYYFVTLVRHWMHSHAGETVKEFYVGWADAYRDVGK